MVDATTCAAGHQPRHNAYGDLLHWEGKDYELGLNLEPGSSSIPSPTLALRF